MDRLNEGEVVMTKHVIVVDIVGLELQDVQSGLTPNIEKISDIGEYSRMAPAFPAVTCTVQASLLSGEYPNRHGIISNGLYDRGNYSVSFWEQSSNLVQSARIWDLLKASNQHQPENTKTAVLFWQNTMYTQSDIVVTPRPIHMKDGVINWCYSRPPGFYDERLKPQCGEFNLADYWGPFASPKSSDWICKAAEYTLQTERPNLMLVYIPHIDYSAQKFGKKSDQVRDDLRTADDMVGRLEQTASDLRIRDNTSFVILSEYAFNDVRSAVPLNLKLRDAGFLAVRKINSREYIDHEYSVAFAMVDHQIAHLYIKKGYTNQIKRLLESIEGVDKVLCTEEDKKLFGINHERSGELIAISDRDKWFSYYWWYDENSEPAFARTVDIHRKPGYDPLELYFDQKTKSISLNTDLIKGSHGRPRNDATGEGFAFYSSDKKTGLTQNGTAGTIECVNIKDALINLIS
jgi:predicted AlkP superfamily pyrophosphatase or phosphodiesterase